MFALSYAQRYPAQVGGVVLLDSMHPDQDNAFAGTDRLLRRRATLARTGLARVCSRSAGGQADDQAAPVRPRRHRDAGRAQPGGQADEPRRPPLAVVTAGTGSAGLGRRTERPRHAVEHSLHRTVAGATHQSLIDDKSDAAQSSRAIARRREGRADGKWLTPRRRTAAKRPLARDDHTEQPLHRSLPRARSAPRCCGASSSACCRRPRHWPSGGWTARRSTRSGSS